MLDRHAAPNANSVLVAARISGPRRAERAQKTLANQPRADVTTHSNPAVIRVRRDRSRRSLPRPNRDPRQGLAGGDLPRARGGPAVEQEARLGTRRDTVCAAAAWRASSRNRFEKAAPVEPQMRQHARPSRRYATGNHRRIRRTTETSRGPDAGVVQQSRRVRRLRSSRAPEAVHERPRGADRTARGALARARACDTRALTGRREKVQEVLAGHQAHGRVREP